MEWKRIGQGWQTCGTRNGFLGTRHALLYKFFRSFLTDQRLCIVKNIHIFDCLEAVYELPLLPNNSASETF